MNSFRAEQLDKLINLENNKHSLIFKLNFPAGCKK